jgi:hypothetical protein
MINVHYKELTDDCTIDEACSALHLLSLGARILGTTTSPSEKAITDFVSLCLSYSSIENQNYSDSDDIGVCGVLEFLLTSDGKLIDSILKITLPHFKTFASHVRRCHASEELPPSHLEHLMHHLTKRLLRVSLRFPVYRDELVQQLFFWINSFIQEVKNGKGSTIVHYSVAAIVGILSAVKFEYAFVLSPDDEKLSLLFETLFSDSFRKLIPVKFKFQTAYCQLGLYSAVANAGKEYGISLLLQHIESNAITFDEVWDELICQQKISGPMDHQNDVSKTLDFLYKTMSQQKWILFIIDYPNDSDFLITLIQFCVISSIYLTNYQSGTIDYIKEFLVNAPELPECQSLDAYLTAIEGLGVLTIKY